MIEQTNEIVHKMNSLLPAVLRRTSQGDAGDAAACGVDGSARMSKSLGNTLHLDPAKRPFTVPVQRHGRTDPII